MHGVLDSAGPETHSRCRAPLCCFLKVRRHQRPGTPISELDTQPTDTPVQRFECGLTTALAWLGARVVRYSFPVRLFHSLLHAGLSRRYPEFLVRLPLVASKRSGRGF